MKRIIKPLAAILAVLILLTGCQADTSWVYSSGEVSLPAGVYINYLMASFNEAFNKLYEKENEEYNRLKEENPDAEAPKSIYDMEDAEILALELEGISTADWVSWYAQKLSKRYMAVDAKMKELGLSLTADEIAESKITARDAFENIASYDESYNPIYGRTYFPNNGISENSIMLISQANKKQSGLFYALYGAGGQYEVPEQEIRDYFSSEYVHGQQLVMRKPSINDYPMEVEINEDEELTPEQQAIVDALTAQNQAQLEQDLAALSAQAMDYAIRMQSGESIEDLTWDYDKSRSEAPDSVLRNEDGILDFILKNDDYSSVGWDVLEGLKALKPGESTLIDQEYYYILIRRLDIFEYPEDLETYRKAILTSLRYESDYLPKLDEWADNLELSVNNASLRRYTADKLK